MSGYDSCTLKHLTREKIVNARVKFVKNAATAKLYSLCDTITMEIEISAAGDRRPPGAP
jgi:hypothetical protein